MRSLFASLTSRLVVTAVVLVAVVSVAIAAVTTLAIQSSLMERLDREVKASVSRASDHDGDRDEGGGPRPALDPRYQGPGTLIAAIDHTFPGRYFPRFETNQMREAILKGR